MTKPQNILLVIPTLGQGGAQRVMTAIADDLLARGHRVSLLTFTRADARHFYLPSPAVERIHLGTLTGSTARQWSLLKTPMRLRGVLRGGNFDTVLSFQDFANFFTLIASIGQPGRVVVSERQDLHHYRFNRVRSLLRRLLYPRADRVVVQTASIAAQLPADWQARVVTIPNAIPRIDVGALATDTRPEHESEPERALVIGAGRLEPQKDFSLLVDAVASHPRLRHHCTVHIYGEGSLRGALQARIDAAGLQDVVLLKGLTDRLWHCMANASVFVMCSAYEGFPNVLGEAIALGLPSIGYDSVSGVSDLIEHEFNGLLLDGATRDPSALGNAIARVLTEHGLADRLRRNTRTIRQRFDPDAILAQWRALLLDDIAAAPGSGARG